MGFAVCPIDTIVCHYAAKVQYSNYSKIDLVGLFLYVFEYFNGLERAPAAVLSFGHTETNA